MKQKKTFTTIFTDAENFHLVKDVGQLPYFMFKTEGFHSNLVSYKNTESYSFLNKEVKGLELTLIPKKGRIFYFEIGILSYLLSHSKTIDVLNLFHFKKGNFLYLLIYKLLNPKGKSYIKLDMDILFFKKYNSFFFSNYKIKNYFLQILTSWIFKFTDILSVESEDAKQYLLQVYPELKDKLICIPNGIDDISIQQEILVKPYQEKENIILTVGRIGTDQKNTELLLDALKLIDLKDWKVYIIGPIEEEFKSHINTFFQELPQLKDKVIFTGNISDRLELFDWYNKAKIFCLSSRHEGFPIAFPEALYFGNHIITSPVSSAKHITENGQYGIIAEPTAQDFAMAIQKSIAPNYLSEEKFRAIRDFSMNNFVWTKIVKKLAEKLNS
ncbi:glycosyltransferase family 4 protein [Daejeonella sp.]|uniref:glycosyltransferase family 4 protein n=1 Tax=Daejeonella sp. TaxID=2805397 RepID=UPI0025BCAB20|nr:glycosyltransferase family 4 protein [Daejeonella sp.]